MHPLPATITTSSALPGQYFHQLPLPAAYPRGHSWRQYGDRATAGPVGVAPYVLKHHGDPAVPSLSCSVVLCDGPQEGAVCADLPVLS